MLKTKIRAPFFELGPKNYIIGKKSRTLPIQSAKQPKNMISGSSTLFLSFIQKKSQRFLREANTAMSQLLLWMISQRAAKMAWPSLNVL